MDWTALKSNMCPACGSYLEHPDEQEMIYCTEGSCDFKIRNERYKQLVSDLDDDPQFRDTHY